MSRVPMASQCRRIKPAAPNDKKIVQCQRRIGHEGPHSSGKHYTWTGTYTATPERRT
jgi:hypothetical protein